MDRIAIIGTGISGLGCAYFLRNRYQLTLYEKADYVGGHTHTLNVEDPAGPVPIDTGFMTYNQVTYPNLTRLFRELGVASRSSSMSFSVQHLPAQLEFCGSSINHLFGQRRNLFRLPFWKMLRQINRFNKEASAAVRATPDVSMTLGDFVREGQYGEHFLNYYLLPMSCAVWSSPPDEMLEFPAMTLLRFFHNHGFLGLNTQHPWLTVTGGAQRYVDKIVAPLRDRIFLNRGATTVRRLPGGGASVTDESGHTERYEHVILACHADQALTILGDANDAEHTTLDKFKYQLNTALLHTDCTVMPQTSLCWSSWNYRVDYTDTRLAPSTVYWINKLQGIGARHNYFVSINGEESLRPESIVRRMQYEHPLFNDGAVRAQRELPGLNERRTGVYFCGSYFRYGFHEDAFSSALALSRLLAPGTWA